MSVQQIFSEFVCLLPHEKTHSKSERKNSRGFTAEGGLRITWSIIIRATGTLLMLVATTQCFAKSWRGYIQMDRVAIVTSANGVYPLTPY